MLRIRLGRKAVLFAAVLLLILVCLVIAPLMRYGVPVLAPAGPWSEGPDKLTRNTSAEGAGSAVKRGRNSD